MVISLFLAFIFNPVVQPIYQSYIHFEPVAYTTPIRELKKSHKVTRGLVCWHPFEVKCIDDVCGDGKTSYWVIKVNGDSLHFNANSRIKPGDQVDWKFVEPAAAQKPPAHPG